MTHDLPLTEGVYYILLALQKPNHGYGIILDIQTLTQNRVTLGAGTLYGALNTMIEKKWIALFSEEKVSRKKKEYVITELGKNILNQEMLRLKELIAHGEEVLHKENRSMV